MSVMSSINPMVWVWLILAVAFVIAEIATTGLFTIWYAGGSLAALIACGAGGGILLQIILFAAVSLVLLVSIRPLAKSKFNAKRTATNVDSMIGRIGVVEERVDNVAAVGRVQVDGMSWAARTEPDKAPLEEETKVEVLSVEGNKLIVRAAK